MQIRPTLQNLYGLLTFIHSPKKAEFFRTSTHQCTIYKNSLTLQQSIKAENTMCYKEAFAKIMNKVDSPINTSAGVNIVCIHYHRFR